MPENLYIVGRPPSTFLSSLKELGLSAISRTSETASDVQVIARDAPESAVFWPMTAADALQIAHSGCVDRLPWRANDPSVGWDRALVRARLEKHGLDVPPWREAANEQAARGVAGALPLPLSVSPVVSNCPGLERRVDDLADLSLATRVVGPYAADSRLILETYAAAPSVCLLGWVIAGRYQTLMTMGHQPANAPARFPMVLSGPIEPPAETEQLAAAVVNALEIDRGVVRIMLRESHKHWLVTDVDLCPSPQWLPVDLAALAGGTGFWELHARVALGQSPEAKRPETGAAIAWLISRSGQVTETPHAEDLPADCTLVCGVKPGDAVGHVLDVASRNRLGYVVVTAHTAAEAVERALSCRSAHPIKTRSIMEAKP